MTPAQVKDISSVRIRSSQEELEESGVEELASPTVSTLLVSHIAHSSREGPPNCPFQPDDEAAVDVREQIRHGAADIIK